MKLSIQERIVALGLLPEQGNFVTLKIVGQLKEALSFGEDEIKGSEIQQQDGQVAWNPSLDPMKEVEIGDVASAILRDALKKLDTESKLTNQHVGLYMKFVGDRSV